MDLGADDYLTKPFQLLELRARVQAVIRRFYGRTNPIIEVGALQFTPLLEKSCGTIRKFYLHVFGIVSNGKDDF